MSNNNEDQIWYDSLAARSHSADDNEEKLWHRCHLCEYGPDGGLDAACNGCGDEHNGRIITKWKPDKTMLAWHEHMLAKHPHLAAQHQRLATEDLPRVHALRDRPSFRQIYMRMAHELAGRSTCRRLQVGCVITSTDYRKVLSVGYNGNASGLPNDCDSDEESKCGCLHAEENAVINCDSPRYVEKVVFCTHLPCRMCAKRIINMGGVQVVYYNLPYRSDESKDMLIASAIQCCSFQVEKP
jgi:dCMP deaminase